MEAFASTLVARELPKPRVNCRLDRGEYDMPVGEPSARRAGFPWFDARGCPSNRLGLAGLVGFSRSPPLGFPWSTAFGNGFSSRLGSDSG